MTRASVIIVYYNRYPLLVDCLQALQPTLGADDEVVMVNNHSPEGHQDDLPRDYPWVKVINSPKNLGISGGNNLAVEQSRGEFLAFLNPDTVVTPGWLEALINTLNIFPKAGMVTSKLLLRQRPNVLNTAGNDMHVSGLTLCRGMGLDKDALNKTEEVSANSGASFVIRRDFYDAIGGFDNNIFLYMEDSDLSLRCRLAGRKIVFEPKSVVYHDYALTFGPNKTFLQEAHRYYLLVKNYRYATLLFLLPTLLLAEIVTWGYSLLKDRANLGNKTRAYRWILSNWRMTALAHRNAQKIRKISDRQLISRNTTSLDYAQTGKGLVPWLAHLVFDSLFWLLKKISLLFIWW